MSSALSRLAGPIRGHRLLAAVVVSIGVVGGWVAIAGRVLVSVGHVGPADAVMVLSGERQGWRLAAGVDALRLSGADRLVVSIDALGPVSDPRPDVLRYLEDQGVSPATVRFVVGAQSTADEAGFAAALARRCGWRSLIVVTSPYHTGRAGWTFRRAIGDAAEVTTVASGEPFGPWTWWSRERDTEAVLLEWVKGLASMRYLLRPPPARDPGVPC